MIDFTKSLKKISTGKEIMLLTQVSTKQCLDRRLTMNIYVINYKSRIKTKQKAFQGFRKILSLIWKSGIELVVKYLRLLFQKLSILDLKRAQIHILPITEDRLRIKNKKILIWSQKGLEESIKMRQH